MSFQTRVGLSITAGGKSFNQSRNISTDGLLAKEVEVPAAKNGQLTTRTDANTGTLTMSPGHGITTAARLDLYWDGGRRRGIVVGSVSSNTVPIDLGSGDDLPTNNTLITAMVPIEEDFPLTGDDVVVLAMKSEGASEAQVVLAAADDSEHLARVLELEDEGEDAAWHWQADAGDTNPIAGDAVAKVFLSHANPDAAQVMGVVAAFN